MDAVPIGIIDIVIFVIWFAIIPGAGTFFLIFLSRRFDQKGSMVGNLIRCASLAVVLSLSLIIYFYGAYLFNMIGGMFE